MRARLGNLRNDARALDLLAFPQLGLKSRVARGGHRDLVHRRSSLKDAKNTRGPALIPAPRSVALSDLRPVPLPPPSGRRTEVGLQRTHLQIAALVGFDPLRRRNRT